MFCFFFLQPSSQLPSTLWQKLSKVSVQYVLLCKVTIESTLENVCLDFGSSERKAEIVEAGALDSFAGNRHTNLRVVHPSVHAYI
jgi:hypothetical protein